MIETETEKKWPDSALTIESMDLDAQGVARRANGKVVFVDGALPFEVVRANVHRKKDNWEKASLLEILHESSQRVTPQCPHFGLHAGACGGCKMQHLEISAQLAIKQRVLEDHLRHLGKVTPETVLRPIQGPAWGYRYRARLSVRYVAKKDDVLVGFHERKSRYVADMRQCPVLPPHVDAMLLPLRQLIVGMDARETLPQIEVACGDHVTALLLRHMEPLSARDTVALRAFAQHHKVQWWLQSKGPDTVKPMEDSQSDTLSYRLPDFDILVPFKPSDFTQVNPQINRVLVTHALRLLDVKPHERVIDWFCGLGNFTLPLATLAREVLGIEGSETLVNRATENYVLNQSLRAQTLAPTRFVTRNLFEMSPETLIQDGSADKWLVDPPREGAFALVQTLAKLHQQPELRQAWEPPKRIVYVSCNPATLARDANVLVNEAGYRIASAGAINMFAHTAHVESVAVFHLD